MGEIAAKSIIGMPVYSISEGDSIGVVKNIILDPVNKELLALAVDRRGWYRDVRIIAYSKVKSIGHDAITIEEKNVTERVANLPKMVKYMDQPTHLVGNRVISDDGHTLGKVDEFYLNDETGKICRLDVSGGIKGNMLSGKVAIKGDYIMTIGNAAIVVTHHCFNDLQELDSVFKVNFQAAKEKTGHAWQSTVNTSKKLGESFAAKRSERQKQEKKGQEDFAYLPLEGQEEPAKFSLPHNLKSKISLKSRRQTEKQPAQPKDPLEQQLGQEQLFENEPVKNDTAAEAPALGQPAAEAPAPVLTAEVSSQGFNPQTSQEGVADVEAVAVIEPFAQPPTAAPAQPIAIVDPEENQEEAEAIRHN